MKIGFIGGGAMCEALVKGILACGMTAPEDIYVSDHKQERCDELHERYHVKAAVGAAAFAKRAGILFLAVKPQAAEAAMHEVAHEVHGSTIIASVVAGLTLSRLQEQFQIQPVIRIMPNTPMSVGAGMSAYALGSNASQADADKVTAILSAAGRAVCVKENLMDAVTGLSGSGPAYAFLVIDALADGGVAAGLPRPTAITLAAQTMLGAAKMVLETGLHPDVLRDQVTSPAGTTIEGVRVLEQHGVRSAFLEAVLAAAEKSVAMGTKK